jgi:F-type H+-transporting ATPase subunit gamma
MPSLKDIRLRIKSVQNTQQITRAMKMVSTAKLRRAQDAITRLRPYALKLRELLANLITAAGEYQSPYAAIDRKIEKVLILPITSNKGLAGSFNSNITRFTVEMIHQKYAAFQQSNKLKLICIGRKGYEYFARRGYPVIGENNDLFTKLNFADINALATTVMEGYLNREWDAVDLVFNEFKNVATQVRAYQRFLPIEFDTKPAGSIDYIFEPDKTALLDNLIPQILKMQFYRVILESNAAEHGARAVAMDKASTNAQELIGSLRLQFNKARQAAITKEILEIVGGAEALSN